MLYGGQAGGGKSALLCGLPLQEHRRSLLLRREYGDLGGLTDQMIAFNGKKGFVGSPRPKVRREDGSIIDFGACQYLGDELAFQGQARDFYGFDEVTQFLEQQVRFIIGWNRPGPGVGPDQNCRVIFASNPPTNSTGDWIIPFFGPWLDPTHPNPAKDGELRWCLTDPDGNDMWVDGPEPVQFPGRSKPTIPRSRTFVRASLEDNPYLINTDYQSVLDAMPEPFRSAYRDGNFMLAREDDLKQAIPTSWVMEAQKRWQPNPPEDSAMSALGCDPAQGGADNMVISTRYDWWFSELIVVPGKRVPQGRDVGAEIIKAARDGCDIAIDLGGGYGSVPYEMLEENGIKAHRYKGQQAKNLGKSADGHFRFVNRRSEIIWKLREGLDPSQPGGSRIALPPGQELLSDLTTPNFEITSRGIKVETKDSVKKRLGRSTDYGDAVCLCWWKGDRGHTTTSFTNNEEQGWHAPKKRKKRKTPKVSYGKYENRMRGKS